MSRATPPHMRKLAKRIVAHAAREDDFHTIEMLRPHLATLMGSGGFRALLLRALTLAHPEAPSLRSVQVNDAGTLEVPESLATPALAQVETALLAQFLGLLDTFIGESLTLQIVRQVFGKGIAE